VVGLKVLFYGSQGPYSTQYHTLLPMTSSLRSLALGHLKVRRLSTKGCQKWLKDRKDRHLSLDEIKTYCQIVTTLAKTIEIQAAVDELYPMVEETLLAISSD